MPRYLSILFLALCSSGLLWTVSCGNGSFEGQRPNDCIDGNDNDMDGTIDCEDEGCAGSPQCEPGDDDDDDDDTIPTGDDDTAGNTVLVSGSVDSGGGLARPGLVDGFSAS